MRSFLDIYTMIIVDATRVFDDKALSEFVMNYKFRIPKP